MFIYENRIIVIDKKIRIEPKFIDIKKYRIWYNNNNSYTAFEVGEDVLENNITICTK